MLSYPMCECHGHFVYCLDFGVDGDIYILLQILRSCTQVINQSTSFLLVADVFM